MFMVLPRWFGLLTPLAMSLALVPEASGHAHLVKDIRTTLGTTVDAVGESAVVGDVLFFAASTTSDGSQLWRTDGTEAGTGLVKDLGQNAGPSSLTVFQGLLYFVAGNGDSQAGLFRSDGSADGTRMVVRLPPASRFDGGLTVFGGELYFGAADPVGGDQLWKTDGTEDGTVRVTDFFPAPVGLRPRELTVVGGHLFFFGTAPNPARPYGLWTTDGTNGGTRLLADFVGTVFGGVCPDICPTFGPAGLVDNLGIAYFMGDDGTAGLELWKSDGTRSGTRLVADIFPGAGNAFDYPQGLLSVDGTIYFAARDPEHGSELWRSDGTTAGTRLVVDINPGPGDALIFLAAVPELQDRMMLVVDEGFGQDLWISDGTAAGTVRLGGPSALGLFASGGGFEYFPGSELVHGRELWRSDGTPEGTALVADLRRGPGDSDPILLKALDGWMYFGATADDGFFLWRTDGSASGTSRVRRLDAGDVSSNPLPSASVGGTLLFTAEEEPFDRRFWLTSGTEEGTFELANATPGPDALLSGAPSVPTLFHGALYFAARDNRGLELWRTDGSIAGTGLFKDIAVPGPGSPGSSESYPSALTVAGNQLFFSAADVDHGDELWVTDGTPNGTHLVKDVEPGAVGSIPQWLAAVGSTLFFEAYQDFENGPGLWKSDGTEAGTVEVRHVPAERMVDAGGTLYFVSPNPDGLWKSDGTSTGTILVKTIPRGESSIGLINLLTLGASVFFGADDAERGRQLWKSDGTVAGTDLVRDIRPAQLVDFPVSPVVSGGRIFFLARDDDHGTELWASDGTPGGTNLVKDIRPGPAGSDIANMVDVAGILLFGADDGVNGKELWRSDGTEAGTSMVEDLVPGPYSSSPTDFFDVGPLVYFSANDGVTGRELWVIALRDLGDAPNRRVSPPAVDFRR